MVKTISTHNGSKVCKQHNIRANYVVSKEPHIDPELTPNNEILIDIPIEKAYQDIFGAAVEDYNQRMKEGGHSERRIENYLQKITNDKRKHPVYEMIVQIGDRNDTGLNAPTERECIKEFIANWDNRNPNLKLIGAYIHADEREGTLHAHLDYVPISYNHTRGPSVQTALVRALGQQGFEGTSSKHTAQIAWQRSENKALEDICTAHGIKIKHINSGRKHMDTPEYKEYAKKIDNLKEEIDKLEGHILTAQERKKIKGEAKKSKITGAVKGISYEDYLSLMKSADKSEKRKKKIKELKGICSQLKSENAHLQEQLQGKISRKDISEMAARQKLEEKYKNKLDQMKTTIEEINQAAQELGIIPQLNQKLDEIHQRKIEPKQDFELEL